MIVPLLRVPRSGWIRLYRNGDLNFLPVAWDSYSRPDFASGQREFSRCRALPRALFRATAKSLAR
ncbi:hypothetical protein ABIA06_000217 [Bradyrhizobium yuanmingense]